nr:hypothetical protein Iba_chr13bCG12610 [Ipomoea batatas]
MTPPFSDSPTRTLQDLIPTPRATWSTHRKPHRMMPASPLHPPIPPPIAPHRTVGAEGAPGHDPATHRVRWARRDRALPAHPPAATPSSYCMCFT